MKTSRDDIVERAFPVFLKKDLDGASIGVDALAERLLAEGRYADPADALAEADSLCALIEGAGVLAAVADDSDLEERFRRLLGSRLNDA